jgi:hypothetical protein
MREKRDRPSRAQRNNLPADNGADTTRLDDVQMVHNRRVDGFDLVTGNAARMLVFRPDNESGRTFA